MYLQKQLLKLLASQFRLSNGSTYEQEILKAANHLANCIQYRIDEFYSSYTPSYYERTYGVYHSLTVDDVVNIRARGNVIYITLLFDEGGNHSSLDGQEVNVPFLMNYGYKVKKDVWFKNIPYFGWRKGFYFVEKGIEDFNKTNSLGIKIKVKKPNSYFV